MIVGNVLGKGIIGLAPVLQMLNIRKSFGDVNVLKDVTFELLKGEVHALVGENGAGKSTLMKILMGVYDFDDGKLILNGKEVKFSTPRDAQKRGISMIYQEFSLVDDLSVAENIFMGRLPRRKNGLIDWARIYEEAGKILQDLGSYIPLRERVANLTVAQKQEVEIARALSYNPEILIMDEPTSALSLEETNQLFKIVEIFKKKGVSIIYISHKLDEIFKIADRVTVLRDGRKINTVDINNLSASALIEMMTGKKIGDKIYQGISLKNNNKSMTILELKDFSVDNYLYDINLSVHRGEVVGVGGLVGVGKTELAKSIYGAFPVRARGEYIFDGKEINLHRLKPYYCKRIGIAFVPEDRREEGLVKGHTVALNVVLPVLSRISKIGVLLKKWIYNLVVPLIKEVNLVPPDPEKKVELLSGGNQQKTIIARWLAARPKLFVLDEMTRGVDVGAREEIYKLIRRQADEGAGVLFFSSDAKELLQLADYILVMRNGRIIDKVFPHQVTEESLVNIMFGH